MRKKIVIGLCFLNFFSGCITGSPKQKLRTDQNVPKFKDELVVCVNSVWHSSESKYDKINFSTDAKSLDGYLKISSFQDKNIKFVFAPCSESKEKVKLMVDFYIKSRPSQLFTVLYLVSLTLIPTWWTTEISSTAVLLNQKGEVVKKYDYSNSAWGISQTFLILAWPFYDSNLNVKMLQDELKNILADAEKDLNAAQSK